MDDRRILDRHPLPVARGYRRYVNASGVRERHDHAYYLFEIYLKYAASIAIAAYLAGDGRDHRVNAALKGLARPSLGEWLRFLRECLGFLTAKEGADPAMAAIAKLLEGKEARWAGVKKLYNALRAFRSEGPSEKAQVSLEMLLSEVVAYRNRVLGHGAPLASEHYGEFAALLADAFGDVLDASPYLTALRLVSFDAIRVQGGSRVECEVIELMGDAPTRLKSPLSIAYGDRVPAEKELHLLREDGTFLCLAPLLIAHRDDVYFLNDAEGAPEYLSYSTGERHRPSGMGAVEGDLFERILGYRPDEGRLSRMGDDVAPAPLAAGEKRLGDYRIVREVGRGGMGTVFEAAQESLGRRVALKILPGTFALDPKRVERFRREARATARIHHPSIVPVYEVGEAEGTHYYAMEFVEGESLDRLLEKARAEAGARPAAKGSSTSDPAYIHHAASEIASVAEGIEKAHGLGLIHRDVEPSNILVDRGGRYVLVDFGLVHEEAAATLTRSGELVGTLGYMPPEQVSRGAVDARADVYSLGATLYEALTLEAPFGGKSEHDTQRAILFEDPVPPRRRNARIPRDLETIILHAMEKNPERRYPSAAALAADLRRFLRREPIEARPQPAWRKAVRLVSRHRVAVGAALVLLLAATAAVLTWRYWPEKRIIATNQRRLTSDPGLTTEGTASRDGTLIAYASDRASGEGLDIWVQPFRGGEARRLTTDPADDREPDISGDGKSIVFRSERDGGGLYVVPVEGGEERHLAPEGRRPRFSPDGSRIAYWTGQMGAGAPQSVGKIFVIPSGGCTPEPVAADFASARYPVWSVEGKRMLFLGRKTAGRGMWDWWTAPLGGGEAARTGLFPMLHAKETQLAADVLHPSVWTEPGDRVFFSGSLLDTQDLWAVSISPETFTAYGSPVRLTAGTGLDADPRFVGSGRLIYSGHALNVDIYSLPLVASEGKVAGDMVRLTRGLGADIHPALTADGTKLVYASKRGGYDILMKDFANGQETALTSDRGWEMLPLITPDGSKVLYNRDESEFLIDLTTRDTRQVPGTSPNCYHVSRDGRMLLCPASWDPPVSTVLLDAETGSKTEFLGDPRYNIYDTYFSPDERWVTFTSVVIATGFTQLFIVPYAPGAKPGHDAWIPVTDGQQFDDIPRWSPDGNLVYFTSERDGFRCIWAQRLDPVSKRPQGEAFPVHHLHSARLSLMNVSLGDAGICIARDRLVLTLGEMTGNIWAADLREER